MEQKAINDFRDLAGQGKNDWWRYAITFAGLLIGCLFIGAIPQIMVMVYSYFDHTVVFDIGFQSFNISGIHPIILTLVFLFPFVCGLIILGLCIKFVHKRALKTLITPYSRIRLSRVLIGAAIWVIFIILTSIADAVAFPGSLSINHNLNFGTYIITAIFAIIIVPMQTSFEEIFFRGYLLQSFARWKRGTIFLVISTSLLFLLVHVGNPEVSTGFLATLAFYFIIGAGLAFIALGSNGLEFTLGIHAAQNLLVFLFINPEVSALPIPSLLAVKSTPLTIADIVILIGGLFIIYKIAHRLDQRDKHQPDSEELNLNLSTGK